jgi:hypothetical protein
MGEENVGKLYTGLTKGFLESLYHKAQAVRLFPYGTYKEML